MHEIIHLSLSAQANHLSTHFYNQQESYFVFDDSQVASKSHVDPSVLFRAGIATDGRTPTFTPRTLIWDMRGGYGSLRRSNALYSENFTGDANMDLSHAWDSSKPLTVLKEDQVLLSEYQQALDSGVDVIEKASNLNVANTKYWSDYTNIYYNPKSFHQLKGWEYDPVKYPQGKPRGEEEGNGRKFIDYEVGVNEFNDLNVSSDDSYLDTVFRPFVEECDSLSGLSLATETDSAWGGFSAKILEELREDYIPKSPVFVWGLYDNLLGAQVATNAKNIKQSRQQVLSRIKTTMALAKSATLLIPLTKPHIPTSVLPSFDAESNWHTSALFSLPFETLSVLSSLRQNDRISMQNIADSLQGGSNRNIVASLDSSIIGPAVQNGQRKKVNLDFSGSVFKQDSAHYFSKVATLRPGSVQDTSSSNFASDQEALWESLFHGQQLQNDGTSQGLLNEFKCSQPFSVQKAFPANALNIDTDDSIYVSMGITTAPRKHLKDMHTFVSKFVRTSDEGREELKEETSTMAEMYEWGWNSSDDEEDDL